MKAPKFNKKFADVSISVKIQNFDNLAIFRLKYNKQHSGIPKSQIKTLATFS